MKSSMTRVGGAFLVNEVRFLAIISLLESLQFFAISVVNVLDQVYQRDISINAWSWRTRAA